MILKDRPPRLARLGRNVFHVTQADDMEAEKATIDALIRWLQEISTYDTLKNMGIKQEDLLLMAQEIVRVGGLVQGALASTHPLIVDEVLAIYKALFE